MAETTIIAAVHKFLAKYPGLADGELNVDILPEEAGSFALEARADEVVTKRYLGGSMRQFLFTVAMREVWGSDAEQQMANLAALEALAGWIEEQNRGAVLPELGEGRIARRIEVIKPGCVVEPGSGLARYQMECRLEYYQKEV